MSTARRVAPRAAARGGRGVESPRELFVGLGGGEREVECAALLVDHHLGELAMQLLGVVRAGLPLGRRREQRVGGPHALALDGDDACVDRGAERGRAEQVMQLRDAEVAVQGEREQHLDSPGPRGRRPAGRAPPRRDRGRAGRCPACRGRDRPASARPRSRTAGCPSSSRTTRRSRWCGRRSPVGWPGSAPRRAQADGADVDPGRAARRGTPSRPPYRRPGRRGQQERDGLGVQPAGGVRDRLLRRAVDRWRSSIATRIALALAQRPERGRARRARSPGPPRWAVRRVGP